jgi:hypothetical protein
MVRLFIGLCLVVAVAAPAFPKPIAFADGTTVMAEYGAGTMQELQIFYAPRFDYSLGGGHLDFTSDEDGHREHINYARLNWLAHRWNLDDAQANVFVWGGAGSATSNRFEGARLTARRLAGDIVLLHRGRLVESGPAEGFFEAPATELARKFIAGELLV